MVEENELLAWVSRAEEDYLVAQSVMRRKRPLPYIACFHAQQCAEKYFKAILVATNQPFSKVHDLLVLNQECAQVGIIFTVSDDLLSILSTYAVRVRYPGEDPTPDEAHEALAIARAVRRFARRQLGLK